jgi:hypothetical protein
MGNKLYAKLVADNLHCTQDNTVVAQLRISRYLLWAYQKQQSTKAPQKEKNNGSKTIQREASVVKLVLFFMEHHLLSQQPLLPLFHFIFCFEPQNKGLIIRLYD